MLTTFHHWVASDALGIITVAPLLIEFASSSRDRLSRSELTEGVLAVVALALVCGLAIFQRWELLATVGPVALLFAPLLWLAARCRPVFAAAAAFIVSLSIVWTTTFGIGYFGNPSLSLSERVLAAQFSILLVTLAALVLAALFAEIRDKRRVAEAALQASETQRYLIETERLAALGGLVAGVAHEINTPVGTSLTVASTLAHRCANFSDQIASGEVRRSQLAEFAGSCSDGADQLVANLQRAGDLIQSFKQVAVDRSHAERRIFDLRIVTEQIVASVRPGLPRPRRDSLALEIPPDITLDSYPGAYGQVLTNLIFNAVIHGFADDADGHMLIKARRLGTDQVEITFSDDGSGIPEHGSASRFRSVFHHQTHARQHRPRPLHRPQSRNAAAWRHNYPRLRAGKGHVHLHDASPACARSGRAGPYGRAPQHIVDDAGVACAGWRGFGGG